MFKVGDLVEILDGPKFQAQYRPYIGMQAEIVSELLADPDGLYHRIKLSNGEQLYAKPRILRKIPPRQDWIKLCRLHVRPNEVTV